MPAWENTLIVDMPNYEAKLLNVPAGVGLTLWLHGDSRHIRSRYLLVTEETASRIGLDRLRLLASAGRGNLYVREN
jgi:hypothetical protein